MKKAPAKAPEWPKTIRNGSVILKIYRVENKGRESFILSYHAAGKHMLKMFASLAETVSEGKASTHQRRAGRSLAPLDRIGFSDSGREICKRIEFRLPDFGA